jgi:hypothetical protein
LAAVDFTERQLQSILHDIRFGFVFAGDGYVDNIFELEREEGGQKRPLQLYKYD